VTKLCEEIWKPVLPRIERWADSHNDRASLAPVPSSSGLSERFAHFIWFWLASRGVHVRVELPLRRQATDRQIKDIDDWPERLRAASRMFTLRHAASTSTVLLIDDVAASGSSMRACACLLRRSGASVVAGAVASADLTAYIARFRASSDESKDC
jgi:predicted amidophosphoribosyltransferase